MPVLDDAEPYFGKPGEIIVVGLSGARTYPRMGNPTQERQEAPRTPQLEMKYASPSTSQRNSGYNLNAENYRQPNAAPYGAAQKYSDYGNQGAYRQAAAAPSYVSSRQYPPASPGFYESSASYRY